VNQPELQPAQALLGLGEVRHTRLRPMQHSFAYPTFFLLLPMRSLRRGAGPGRVAFHDSDHGDGGPDSLAWIEALLQREGITDADGEIWLHCMPRVLGYAFKPVSFWYCHRADNRLMAIVVEVNNTFGERHCYLLHGAGLAFGVECQASKVFHVSPFCQTSGRYRFRFMRNDLPGSGAASPPERPRTVARIEHDDEQGPLLLTSVSGELHPLTSRTLRRAFLRMPLLTLGVMARIHWQALRLWLGRVPLIYKPAPPATPVTHSHPPSNLHSNPHSTHPVAP
jgi:DUF1365 family protein